MKRELCMTDWDELLAGTSCDAWSTFKQRLVDIIEKHIPDKKDTSKQTEEGYMVDT